jgi:hypothetical protein
LQGRRAAPAALELEETDVTTLLASVTIIAASMVVFLLGFLTGYLCRRGETP